MALLQGAGNHHRKSHTEACRKRIESEMEKDPVLRVLLQKTKDRIDSYLSLSREVARRANEEHKTQRELAPVAVPNSEDEKKGDGGIPEID